MGWYAVWGASVGAAQAGANQPNRDSGSFASRRAADARSNRVRLRNTQQARGCHCRGRLKFWISTLRNFHRPQGSSTPYFKVQIPRAPTTSFHPSSSPFHLNSITIHPQTSRTTANMGKSKDVKTGSKASKAEVNTLLHVKSGKITKPYKQAKPATKVATKEVAPSKKEKKSKKAPTPSESSESESESEESSSSSSESEEEAKPVKAAAKKEVTTSSESSDSSSSSDEDAASSGSDSDNNKSDSSSESGSDSSDSSESEEETVPAKAVKAAKAVVNGAAKVVAKATVRSHCDKISKNQMLTFSQESGSDSDSDSDSSESEAEAEKVEKKSESGSDSSDSDSSDEEESTEESSEDAAPSKKRKADDDEEEVSAKKTKSEAVEDTGSKNLFVGNLSWNIDDEWLYREFEEFGEITGARVISDRDSGRSKGFGYVEFANSADAAKALAAKKGALIDGREANVDFSTPRDNAAPKDRANARAATYGDQKNPESDTLFVGNISFEANEDIIGEAFGAHGTVVNVRLPTDM